MPRSPQLARRFCHCRYSRRIRLGIRLTVQNPRMKRAALDRARTLNVWGRHYRNHLWEVQASGGQGKVKCVCDQQPGRFRKGQKVAGCGKPQCYLCHGEKLLGIPKHRDRKMEQVIE